MVKVGMLARDALELVAIVHVLFVTSAEYQPRLMPFMALGLFEEPVNHPANWRNARTGGDEDGIASRFAEGEESMRAVKADGRTFFEIAQPIRQEPVLDPIEAKVEGVVAARSRSHGVGAGVLFAVGLALFDGEE